MDINIKGANEHNLKNVSVSIPMYQITGITGVSGSGKSTLLRDILASKGAINYTLIHTKTVRDALRISDYVNADSIENLPQTIFIDVKSSVKNSSSTVSTISGIHELLKNIFTEFGNSSCALCGNETFCELTNSTILKADILYDEKSQNADPFWEKTAADYFTGLALGLFEDGTPEQVNLNSLNLMCSLGEERFGGPNNNYIKEYFNGKDPSKPAYINASGTVFTADETKQGIIATFKQKIKLFS